MLEGSTTILMSLGSFASLNFRCSWMGEGANMLVLLFTVSLIMFKFTCSLVDMHSFEYVDSTRGQFSSVTKVV